MTDIQFGRAQASPAPEATTTHRFGFNGTASEYFGIWIVNLFLTIVTLGIYSAWAKVRRLRYFYGNTTLDGHNFEYHAKPMQILIGRIIVVGYLLVINILSEVAPIIAGLLTLPYLILLPWVINKALAFNARMTSYRNVRFGFAGNYWKALGIYIGLPLLAIVPIVVGAVAASSFPFQPEIAGIFAILGLLVGLLIIPFISRASANYIGNNTRFGATEFSTDVPLGPLVTNLVSTILLVIGGFVVSVALTGALFYLAGFEDPTASLLDPLGNLSVFAGLVLLGLVLYMPIIIAFQFYGAGVRNVAFLNTTLGREHALDSQLSRFGYVWIILTNFVATILTIGLLRPWAAVRTWRYLADRTALHTTGSLDGFVAGQEDEGYVAAAEYLDIDGIDFGL